MQADFSKIPSMDSLLRQLHAHSKKIDQIFIKKLLEIILDEIKTNPANHKILMKNREEISEFLIKETEKKIDHFLSPTFSRVINGTGVILHTGLGRAPLDSNIMQVVGDAAGYTTLEIKRTTGKRGERLDHVKNLLNLLTGADDSVVVNNNAAAVLLVLNSLAKRKEVIVSRGELVEIGGSFRMPEVMISSGAKMIEVGSTNKTHLHDYERAISDKTAAILLVHPSNYKIIGFTEKPEVRDILTLAHKHKIPVIFDLGSGAFVDMSQFGFEYEPVARDVIAMDFDVVTFSGDKLLGGPQAGIIIGKKNYLEKIKKNHLLRALRCDKINLAILSTILRQYLHPASISRTNTTLQLFSRTKNDIIKISKKVLHLINKKHHENLKIVEAEGRAGSGAYPVHPIPSIALQINSPKYTAEKLSRILRLSKIPIFGYIEDDIFHINFLTLLEEDLPLLGVTLNKVL
jgi:L-seryl-tRNA(Ser) seleniumtransferase